jgi:adenylate kinase
MRILLTSQPGTAAHGALRKALATLPVEKQPHYVRMADLTLEAARKSGLVIGPYQFLDLTSLSFESLYAAAIGNLRRTIESKENLVVSTWATYFSNGGFHAAGFTRELIELVKPDLFLNFLDNMLSIYAKLTARPNEKLPLENLLTWRTVESLLTRQIAAMVGRPFLSVPVGTTSVSLSRIISDPQVKRVYLSYPSQLTRIDRQRLRKLKETLDSHFAVFDPITLDSDFISIVRGARKESSIEEKSRRLGISTRDLLNVADNVIRGRVAQDYGLLEQSDFVVAFLPGRKRSAGVMSEVAYARQLMKATFILAPSGDVGKFFMAASTRVMKTREGLVESILEEAKK